MTPTPLQRVLVPLDVGEPAAPLLDLLARLRLPSRTEVQLLHVAPAEASTEQLRSARDELARQASGHATSPSHAVLVGDPAGRIVERAAGEGAGLIVLRSRAASSRSALTRGSVARRVARESPVPVLLLAPSRVREAKALRRILVPVRGSEGGAGRRSTQAVLRLVAALARPQDALVELLAFVEPRPRAVDLAARRARAEAYLEELHGTLGGVAALRRVVTGPPELEVAKGIADEDLLAVPSRHLSGAIGETLLRRCPCALLSVPPP